MDKRRSIKGIIGADSGYEIALMTTFTFDVPFFERAILNQLLARDIKTISVFADARQFTASLSEIKSSNIGRRYLVIPVEISSSFHPKLVLLLGKKKAKLIVSSANLTTSGYYINNEVYNCIEYSEDHPEYQDVIVSAMQYFVKLKKYSYPLDYDVIERIKEFSYYRKAPNNKIIHLLHNTEQPILQQVKHLIEEPVIDIQIAVPYYDGALGALKQIMAAFPNAGIELFVQNVFSTFPVAFNEKEQVVSDISVFEEFADNESNRFYHGKVFLFKTLERSYILYGSANCTYAALTSSLSTGGNAECDLFAVGGRNDFDYYFDNFVICDTPLTASTPLYTSSARPFCYFKYGMVDKDLFLHFGCKDLCEVFIGEEKLASRIEDKELIAIVPESMMYELPEFFNVVIKHEDWEGEIKCWWYSPENLNGFRIRENAASVIKSFELESEGDKYLQDRINLMNAEADCLADIKNANKAAAAYEQLKTIEEELTEDDFFVDYEIPEEYLNSYKAHSEITKIRQLFINRTFNWYRPVFSKEAGNKSAVSSTTEPIDSEVDISDIKLREPTSEEVSFERFLKKKIRAITNPKNENIKDVTPMHLFGLVEEILEVFNKYKYVELFDPEYVAESRAKLFQTLMKKDFSEESEHDRYVVLLECYKAIVNNYYLSLRERKLNRKEVFDYYNKNLLDAISSRYAIRTAFKTHLQDLLKSEEGVLKPAYLKEVANYIEKLFGYKDHDSLVDFIMTEYKCEDIITSGVALEIQAVSNDIRSHFLPKKAVLNEIRNYSLNEKRIDYVKIVVRSTSNSQVQRVEHTVDIKASSCEVLFVYKNGRELSDLISPFYF